MYQVPHDPRNGRRSLRTLLGDLGALCLVGLLLVIGLAASGLLAIRYGPWAAVPTLVIAVVAPVLLAQSYGAHKRNGLRLGRSWWLWFAAMAALFALLGAVAAITQPRGEWALSEPAAVFMAALLPAAS